MTLSAPLRLTTLVLAAAWPLTLPAAAHGNAIESTLRPVTSSVVDETYEPGEVFDNVVSVLERGYYDKEFRSDVLPRLAAGLRDRAHAAADLDAERAVIDELLAQIPVSHLALISEHAYRGIGAELFGKAKPTFGMQLTRIEGRYHATWIFEGGPADLAGVRRGDEVVSIDGVEPGLCPRLDWSTDDAALLDAPLHGLRANEGDRVRLELRRTPAESLEVEIEAIPYSGSMAAEASARVFEVEGRRIGYVHFWYIQSDTPSALLKSLIEGDFAECDGLVLDLRGRGGSAQEAARLRRMLDPEKGLWRRPLVALTDRGTRSAKEVIADSLKGSAGRTLVGERTAGAVIPAAFREVGGGAVLMYPGMTLGKLTERLEGKGVAPDVQVTDVVAYTAGEDAILAAGLRVFAAER